MRVRLTRRFGGGAGTLLIGLAMVACDGGGSSPRDAALDSPPQTQRFDGGAPWDSGLATADAVDAAADRASTPLDGPTAHDSAATSDGALRPDIATATDDVALPVGDGPVDAPGADSIVAMDMTRPPDSRPAGLDSNAVDLGVDGGSAPLDADDPGTRDMLTWMHSQLPDRAFVAVHAEQWDAATAKWIPITEVYQPMRTIVDASRHVVLVRKDALDQDYYGELWPYDDDGISLRTETFPYFDRFDASGSWDQRPDKFRLFVLGQAMNARPYGQGRRLAPRVVDPAWQLSQDLDTFACYSWDELAQGTCRAFQNGVHDDLSLEVIAPFNAVFDGEADGWTATSEYKIFDEAIAIDQVMNGGAARERFIFARKGGVHYGIVRWDNALPKSGCTDGRVCGWNIVQRTVGLRTSSDSTFSWAGMLARADRDILKRRAGLRILQDGDHPGKSDVCPIGTKPRGSFDFDANSASWASDFYDLDGSHTWNRGTAALCVAESASGMALTVPSGCPASNTRGSIHVPSARPWSSVTDATPVPVTDAWVVLCSAEASDHGVYFRLATSACDAGTSNSSSLMPSRDCYDDRSLRCNTVAPGGSWLVMCSS